MIHNPKDTKMIIFLMRTKLNDAREDEKARIDYKEKKGELYRIIKSKSNPARKLRAVMNECAT